MSQQTIAAPATPKPMPRISVAASYVRLAATCMAERDIRYYLCGVLIEPRAEGGAYIVATNGHMLIAIIDKGGECSAPTIIAPNKATLAACPKVAPFDRGGRILRTLEVEGETALGVTNEAGRLAHIQACDTIIEGKFPDWGRVLPVWDQLKPGSPAQVSHVYRNAPFAAMRCTIMAAAQSYTDPDARMLVQRMDGLDNVVHIVMSQRHSESADGWVGLWRGVRESIHPGVKK